MENSKAFLKEKGIMPKISFKDGREHIVVLKKDKKESYTNPQNKQIIEGMKYLVIEGQTPKFFFTGSEKLIVKLSDMEPETKVSIKMINTKGADGKFRSGYRVNILNNPKSNLSDTKAQSNGQINDDDIPIIDDTQLSPEDIEPENSDIQ